MTRQIAEATHGARTTTKNIHPVGAQPVKEQLSTSNMTMLPLEDKFFLLSCILFSVFMFLFYFKFYFNFIVKY